MSIECPYCNSTARLADSSIVYGRSYGRIWLCPNWPTCDAYVGCHKGTKKPLGRMANRELREWKKRAHATFDPVWRSQRMNRNDAYKRLAQKLGISRRKCHIGMFDVETCQRVIEIVRSGELVK